MTEYRCYVFNNFYLQGIQAGIQAAHVTAELFVNNQEAPEHQALMQWASTDKTMIVLNGGMQCDLEEIWDDLVRDSDSLKLPIAKFHESREALNGALTSVAVVVPYHIYAVAEMFERWGRGDDLRYDYGNIESTHNGLVISHQVRDEDGEIVKEIKDRLYTKEECNLMILLRSKRLM